MIEAKNETPGGATGPVVFGMVVPGMPHILLQPEENPGWQRVRDGMEKARRTIDELIDRGQADVMVIYSTLWPSVVGHQIQADPKPTWVHVDELFHDLGSIPYEFRIDADFADAYCQAAKKRGLHARKVAYHGFPIDTGSVVALKLLNPKNRIPATILSSNVYADRAETIVFGKAGRDALLAQHKRAIAVVVTHLSNRMFTDFIDPSVDTIHSAKDEEWNRKILEFLEDGRVEDLAQLSREIHRQIRVSKVVSFKPMWWLSSFMGAHNNYEGDVIAYAPICGMGAAVASLTPSSQGVGAKEFDEEDVEYFRGDRNVLSGSDGLSGTDGPSRPVSQEADRVGAASSKAAKASDSKTESSSQAVRTEAAPKPVGAYPHARRVGDFLYLSGIGPRRPETDEIPGGPIRDASRKPLDYDIDAQTRSCIENIRVILEAAGSSLDRVLDVTVFLVDMDRDFETFNRVYAEYFADIGPARTTVAVRALPTPIAVELKVMAAAPVGSGV